MEQPGRRERRRLRLEQCTWHQKSVRTDGLERTAAIRPRWLGGTAAQTGGNVTWKGRAAAQATGSLSASRSSACDMLPRVMLFSLNSVVNNYSSEQSRYLLTRRIQRQWLFIDWTRFPRDPRKKILILPSQYTHTSQSFLQDPQGNVKPGLWLPSTCRTNKVQTLLRSISFQGESRSSSLLSFFCPLGGISDGMWNGMFCAHPPPAELANYRDSQTCFPFDTVFLFLYSHRKCSNSVSSFPPTASLTCHSVHGALTAGATLCANTLTLLSQFQHIEIR